MVYNEPIEKCKDIEKFEFARGYIFFFPKGFRGAEETELFISKECPDDIKEKVIKLWEEVKADTRERHKKGIYYFDELYRY